MTTRKAFVMLLVLLPLASFAQTDLFPYKDDKIVYSAVNQVDSTLKASDLNSNFLVWWADYVKKFNSNISKETFKLKENYPEKTETKIISKGTFRIDQTFLQSMWDFDLTVELKDGRYRYTIDNIGNTSMFSGLAMDAPMVSEFKPLEQMDNDGKGRATLKKIPSKIKDIIASLEKGMNRKTMESNF